MENKKKVRGGHSGLLWLRQRLHVEVETMEKNVSLFLYCALLLSRVNLSVAVVAMTSNKTHGVFPNGTQETVNLSFPRVSNFKRHSFSIRILTGIPKLKA